MGECFAPPTRCFYLFALYQLVVPTTQNSPPHSLPYEINYEKDWALNVCFPDCKFEICQNKSRMAERVKVCFALLGLHALSVQKTGPTTSLIAGKLTKCELANICAENRAKYTFTLAAFLVTGN
jgi:hypothetical protein